MTRRLKQSFPLLLLLVGASPELRAAQEPGAVLAAINRALGADKVRTLHYSGSGSSYAVTPNQVAGSPWPHRIMTSYVRDLDLRSSVSRLQLVRTDDTRQAEETLNHVIDANSPWASQYEFWLTPFGFLKGATAANTTVGSATIFGSTYKALTVTLPGNHKVVGYINDRDQIEKIETRIGDKDEILVEAQYRDYKDFNGVQIPMMVTEKTAGELSLILIVQDAKAEA